MNKFTFNKKERLKSRKLIEHLFTKGKNMSAFPLKLLYDVVELPTVPLQAGVTVSSRNFKKAIDRNRIKRVVRESYRLQKQPLQQALETNKKGLILFFIYTSKEMPVYKDVQEKMSILLDRLATLPLVNT